jgi:hypothetical protein
MNGASELDVLVMARQQPSDWDQVVMSLEPNRKGNLFKVVKTLAFTDYLRLLYSILFDGLRSFSVRLSHFGRVRLIHSALIWLKGSR